MADSNLTASLDALTAWAHTAHDEPATRKRTRNSGETPCLDQADMQHLFKLTRSVKGSPLPDSMMPTIPR